MFHEQVQIGSSAYTVQRKTIILINTHYFIVFYRGTNELTSPRLYFFCGSFVFLCLVFFMILRLFIATMRCNTR